MNFEDYENKRCFMKIVVLDGYTENPGDLSWDGMKKYLDSVKSNPQYVVSEIAATNTPELILYRVGHN